MFSELNVIDGKAVSSASGASIVVIDPATAEPLGTVPRGDERDVDMAVRAASEAKADWQGLPPRTRATLLFRLAHEIRANKEDLADLESADTGKPRSQSRSEIETSAGYFEYAAGAVDKVTGYTIPVGANAIDFTLREPWGVSAQIVPWNYPLSLATRGVAPALAMGNTVVVKPAEEASLTCLALGRLALGVGIPPGVLNVVSGYGHEAGAALASHPGIDHLTFTGSVDTGTLVMRFAANNIVPVTLELGGKSPHLVFDDVDLDRAVPVIVRGFTTNAGQTCSAGTRLLVQRATYEEALARIKAAVEVLRIGRPEDDPDLGPLISAEQRKRVLGYIEEGLAAGLRLVTGGLDPALEARATGFFVSPTVFADTPSSSRLFKEEIFGPVLCATPFNTEEEAIELANATPYGLSAGIWTSDIGRAIRVARSLQAGMVNINSFGSSENLGIPFGGYKKSGFGREKGLEAMLGYSQLKNVAVNIV